MDAIDRFLRRYNQAVQAGSKEFVFPITQAAELASDINSLMVRALKNTSAPSEPVSIVVDGGRFK